jgi:hypothetical protein
LGGEIAGEGRRRGERRGEEKREERGKEIETKLLGRSFREKPTRLVLYHTTRHDLPVLLKQAIVTPPILHFFSRLLFLFFLPVTSCTDRDPSLVIPCPSQLN